MIRISVFLVEVSNILFIVVFRKEFLRKYVLVFSWDNYCSNDNTHHLVNVTHCSINIRLSTAYWLTFYIFHSFALIVAIVRRSCPLKVAWQLISICKITSSRLLFFRFDQYHFIHSFDLLPLSFLSLSLVYSFFFSFNVMCARLPFAKPPSPPTWLLH